MHVWYYHSPGHGRVGPLSAEQLQRHYRERRMGLDTLVWREGLREWQPADRLIEELGLIGIQPDAGLPPPLPPVKPLGITRIDDVAFGNADAQRSTAGATAPSPRAKLGLSELERPPPAPPQTSGTSGCVIAAIVIGVLGLFMVGILAAIALPAYRDYVKRTQAAQTGRTPADGGQAARSYRFDADKMEATEALARDLVAASMREYYAANGNLCPDAFEFEQMIVRHRRYQGSEEQGWFGIDPAAPTNGVCAYGVRFYGLGPEVLDKTVRYEVTVAGGDIVVGCRNVDLPKEFVPSRCGG